MNSTEASGVSTALRSSLSPSPIKGTKINRCFFCRKKGRAKKGGKEEEEGSFYSLETVFIC